MYLVFYRSTNELVALMVMQINQDRLCVKQIVDRDRAALPH